MSLYQELKRRNVIRVATAYVVAAWLVIQVIETIFPAFGFTDRALRIAVIILGIGFVPAVVGAWVFEWTPEGLKRDTDVGQSADARLNQSRRLDRAIIVVLVVAVSYFAVDKFVFKDSDIDSGFYGERSIIVMPFDIRSSDQEQQHFADGIIDEIRYLLGTIRDLRVIAEYSSNLLEQQDLGVSGLWSELSIGHLLEGSVRKDGNRVRIAARLVETRTGEQLWSDVYERELGDVFQIQDDIARNVLHNLRIEFEGSLPASRNVDPEVRALVAQARQIQQERFGDVGERMLALLERALEIDPDYVPALEQLSLAYFFLNFEKSLPTEVMNQKIEEIEKHVEELDPNNGFFAAGKAWEEMRDGHYEDSARMFLRSLDKELTKPGPIRWAAQLADRIGKLDVAVRLYRHALAIDPLCHQCRRNLSRAFLYAGDYERAIRARERFMISGSGGQPDYAVMLLMAGKPERVFDVFGDIDDALAPMYRAMAHHSLGNADEAGAGLAALQSLAGHAGEVSDGGLDERDLKYLTAQVAAWMGKKDLAFELLFQATEPGFDWPRREIFSPVWREIRDDPRWLEYREALGMSPERLKAIEFNPWLPE